MPQPATTIKTDVMPRLIEIHMLQNHVPASLNRDDLGAPKTAMFGGTLRARISSQCLKRNVRWSEEHFRKVLGAECGTRTRTFPNLVERELKKSSLPPGEHKAIVERAEQVAKKADKSSSKEESDESGTDSEVPEETADGQGTSDKTQLIFLGPDDAAAYVRNIEALRSDKPTLYAAFIGRAPRKTKKEKQEADKHAKEFGKELESLQRVAFEKRPAVDVALYGRMTTSNIFHNVDAAMSVAHAISTHEVVPQADYWTGVDDIKSMEKDGGAAHIAEALFNSATFYKYASLDWPQLLENLGSKNRKLAEKTLSCFLNAFALEVPTGKQHSHAHNNLPDAILIEIKDRNVPTNYANAFVKPAKADEGNDLIFNSTKKLGNYAQQLEAAYGSRVTPSTRLWFVVRDDLKGALPDSHQANVVGNFEELVTKVLAAIAAPASAEGTQ